MYVCSDYADFPEFVWYFTSIIDPEIFLENFSSYKPVITLLHMVLKSNLLIFS
jgi:hypothetical protein